LSQNNLTFQTLQELKEEGLKGLCDVSDLEAIASWRTKYLGRSGKLTVLLRGIGTLPEHQRKSVGAMANRVRVELTNEFEAKNDSLTNAEIDRALEGGKLDVTLPGRRSIAGRLHPTTQIVREICDAFVAMGFHIVEGPEVEWDKYNFEMLNIPKDHPARDMWNSIWIDHTSDHGEPNMLLRTHTSPMQARIMENTDPPVRVIVPGKCYRYEATDSTHEWHFFQVEGLAVDEGITFANLKGTLYEFARRLFGQDRKVRFRCDYFPFVEPGVDMSIDCSGCRGQGCRICKGTGWIEIMGAGMVHPKVLESVGYDPEKYTGFAFGLGPERIAMLKYGIDDIRLFYSNDLRFLRQF
jgi:phenylalanyl-tRNA synthetase alpha chain